MDFDRVTAGTPSGTPPMPGALLAADTLAEAAGMLGATDAAIVEMVAGRGSSIEEAARRFAGAKEKLSDRDTEYVGRRLRDALRTLVQRWHPVSSGSTIRGHIEDGAKPVGGTSVTRLVDGRVAHASESTVRFSDPEVSFAKAYETLSSIQDHEGKPTLVLRGGSAPRSKPKAYTRSRRCPVPHNCTTMSVEEWTKTPAPKGGVTSEPWPRPRRIPGTGWEGRRRKALDDLAFRRFLIGARDVRERAGSTCRVTIKAAKE